MMDLTVMAINLLILYNLEDPRYSRQTRTFCYALSITTSILVFVHMIRGQS